MGKALAGIFLGFFALLARGIGAIVRAVGNVVRRSRAAAACLIILAALLVGGLVDLGMNWGRVYAGVHVGSVDLSGKTEQEAYALVSEAYESRLAENEAVAFASEEELARAGADAGGNAERLSERASVSSLVEEGRAWVADAASLGAVLDVEGMVTDALAIGRDEGGLLERVQAAFGGWTVTPRALYDNGKLEGFAQTIDTAAGDPRVDFGIAVDQGRATVTEGHDGTMVDRAKLAENLNGTLLSEDGGLFAAIPEYAPLRIDETAAQLTCDAVNAVLASPVQFTVAGYVWSVEGSEVGDWVFASAEETDGAWALLPRIDLATAGSAIVSQSMKVLRDGLPPVSFRRDGDSTVALTDGSGQVPDSEKTVELLDDALFASVRASLFAQAAQEGEAAADASGAVGGGVSIEVATAPTPTSLSVDEALSIGLIEEISTYTTTYLNREGSANRVHNIHLAADKLNDSVAKANGGTWSFYDITGECDEAAGFLGAGVIVEGEHDDAVGGGICQVATTVFNAVYESGFPVVRRYNHTLRMTNYPDGRDAAVAWPDLDLVWKNDGTSDVLLHCSYTDTSLTVTLYGVNPGYTVSTQTGEWKAGEAYRTRVECDESMAEGASYVKTAGIDGSSISVYRTVRDTAGNILHEDEFESRYDAETKVVVAGPGTKVQVGDETLVATPDKPQTSKKVASQG